MPTSKSQSFDDLVEQFLGMRLPQQMESSVSLTDLSPDTQDFVVRALTLMKRAGYSVTGFTPNLVQWVTVTAPNILPGAWGGRIPPLTLAGRHKKLDDYIANQRTITEGQSPVFVDLGCGFPPVTSTDTARRFPDWHVYGVDRSFAAYVLYDEEGHYACFDQNGGFQYFQALMNVSGRAMYADPKTTRDRFEKLFDAIYPQLKSPEPKTSQTVEKYGSRLVHNHIRDFEADNLTFIQSDMEELHLPGASAIRCMNVLIYFKPENRRKMLRKIGRILHEDGVLIVGTNGLGIQSRYAVYQKSKNDMVPMEFAFSLDNLGPIVYMPWFTVHENDPESMLLTEVMSAVRRDQPFWAEFNGRIDELLQRCGICQRNADGFLHFPNPEMSPGEYLDKNAELWRQLEEDGYAGSVVDSLKQSGYDAWENSVGDIAIRPSEDSLP